MLGAECQSAGMSEIKNVGYTWLAKCIITSHRTPLPFKGFSQIKLQPNYNRQATVNLRKIKPGLLALYAIQSGNNRAYTTAPGACMGHLDIDVVISANTWYW